MPDMPMELISCRKDFWTSGHAFLDSLPNRWYAYENHGLEFNDIPSTDFYGSFRHKLGTPVSQICTPIQTGRFECEF